MEIEKLIEQRRTVHNYKPGIVDLKIIERALELAILAPNHKKTWPWKFAVSNDRVKKQIATLAVKIKSNKKLLSEIQKKAIHTNFLNCSHFIAIAQKRSDNEFQSKEDYASVACAVQNMSLFLFDQGIATKWSTGAITTDEQTYQAFEIDKLQYELVGLLWVGFADKVPSLPERPKAQIFYSIVK